MKEITRQTKMRKILLNLLILILFGISLIPNFSVLAANIEGPPADVDIIELLERIVDYLFTFLLIVAAIFIVIAAYTFVTAGGDTEKVKTARTWVMYALIGVAVAMASRGLVAMVKKVVGE